MNLEQTIYKLEFMSTLVKEILNSDIKLSPLETSKVKVNLGYIDHYLKDTLDLLEELQDTNFIESLEVDLDKCIPFTEKMFNQSKELTKDVVVDLDEELEGDFW